MDLESASIMAYDMLEDLGLYDWEFKFDRAKGRFGSCNHNTKIISLSKPLTELNSEDVVRQVLIHEAAHALAGHRAGHGHQWQRIARDLGYTGGRTINGTNIQQPVFKYTLICPNCSYQIHRNKKTTTGMTLACGRCCKKNGGYSSAYRFTWVENKTRVAA